MYEVIIGELIIGIVALSFLYMFNKNFLTNRYLEAEKKLRARINHFENNYSDIQRPKEFISGALGELGIEGVMNELGIDPKILNNPFVKGLIEKYAPRVIETLNKKQEGTTDFTNVFR